jgi:hypothetical protein
MKEIKKQGDRREDSKKGFAEMNNTQTSEAHHSGSSDLSKSQNI